MFSIQLKKVASHCGRHENGLALAHRRDCRLGERLGIDVPLIGEKWLDHRAGAVAMRYDMRCRLDLVEKTRSLQTLDDLLSRDESIEAMQRQRFIQFRRWRHAFKKRRIVF